MRRIGNIYHKIADYENLCEAFYLAARGKSMQDEVIAYRNALAGNLATLRYQLLTGSVTMGPYHFFYYS